MRDRTRKKDPAAQIQKQMLSVEERRVILERLMKRCSALTESEALELHAVFPDIIKEHRKVLLDELHNRGLSKPEKEDIEQEAHLELFRYLCRHAFKYGVAAPLRVITRRRRLNCRRSKLRAQETLGVPSSGSEKPESDPPDIDGAVDRRELERRVRELLTPDQWTAFDRIVLKGKSYPEAAAELNAPEPTLRSRVKRAKTVLFELVDRSPPSSEGGAG